MSLLSGRQSAHSTRFGNFAESLAFYNNNRVFLSKALCVIGSLGNLMIKLHISPRTTFSG